MKAQKTLGHTIAWYAFTMDLSLLLDSEVLEKTRNLAKNEREITLQVLQHLREVERRSLYAILSYSTLFEYAVKELKYSESSAQRRISSMRLLKELPELEPRLQSGALPLSTLSQAQSFFRQEKTKGCEKMEILNSLENKSSREVEKELVQRASEPQKFYLEKLRPVSATHSELKLLVDEDFVNELEELKTLVSHQLPRASLKEILSYTMKESIKKLRYKDPINKSVSIEISTSLASSFKNTRYIPAEVKRQVWKREQGQCSFRHGTQRCMTKYYLEFDHILPFAKGGLPTVENLRLRCRAHNQLEAIKHFGTKRMSGFVPRML